MSMNTTQVGIMENGKMKQKEWIVGQFKALISSEPERLQILNKPTNSI
jgi:hypothetical protein